MNQSSRISGASPLHRDFPLFTRGHWSPEESGVVVPAARSLNDVGADRVLRLREICGNFVTRD